jgi:membrane protein YdbS with pleckstrin-like domain
VPERPTPEPTRLLAPEAFRLFLVEVLMSTVPFAAVSIVLAITLVGGAIGFAITAAAVVAVIVAAAVVPRLRMARFRFEVREDEIDLRHGIVIETRTLVPMVRVQHVDTRRTPVSRYFGLAAVAFHTAAGATEIPALREADAAAIRDRIADLALQPEVL